MRWVDLRAAIGKLGWDGFVGAHPWSAELISWRFERGGTEGLGDREGRERELNRDGLLEGRKA
jgi:hypothetical protein